METLFYYNNPAEQKKIIYKDNYKKAGIYVFTHKSTGNKYIGSSLNISQRFVKYFSILTLKGEIKRNNSKIYRAILKYGIDQFTLEIMEHCSPNTLIEREQFYLDNLKPFYNILTIAGKRSGFKHSERTKELQRAHKLGYKVSDETKLKMSSANIKSKKVINIITKETFEFISLRKAAQFLGTSHSQIIIYIKKGKLFKDIYSIYLV